MFRLRMLECKICKGQLCNKLKTSQEPATKNREMNHYPLMREIVTMVMSCWLEKNSRYPTELDLAFLPSWNSRVSQKRNCRKKF